MELEQEEIAGSQRPKDGLAARLPEIDFRQIRAAAQKLVPSRVGYADECLAHLSRISAAAQLWASWTAEWGELYLPIILCGQVTSADARFAVHLHHLLCAPLFRS